MSNQAFRVFCLYRDLIVFCLYCVFCCIVTSLYSIGFCADEGESSHSCASHESSVNVSADTILPNQGVQLKANFGVEGEPMVIEGIKVEPMASMYLGFDWV